MASFGGVGKAHPEADFIVKLCVLALGLISHIPECSSTQGGDTASVPSLAPQGHPSCWRPTHFKGSFFGLPPTLPDHASPPQPIQERLPLPAGRNRRGLSRPKVNIGFSGAAAGTRQRPSLSPHGTEGALTAPRASPGRGGRAAGTHCPPKTLPGQAGLVLPSKSGHGAGVAAVSGSGVRVVAVRGLALLEGGRSWVLPPKGAGVLS